MPGTRPAIPDFEAMRPTLIQMAKDAIAYHDGGLCGRPGHMAWVEQYERALDVLEPPGNLTPIRDGSGNTRVNPPPPSRVLHDMPPGTWGRPGAPQVKREEG